MKTIFLVQHSYTAQDGHDEIKLIGAYASKKAAQLAVRRRRRYTGFRKFPRGFSISELEIGRDQWSAGFVTS